MPGWEALTEGDAGVLLANLVAVVVGEEHVGRQSTLGRVGVCVDRVSLGWFPGQKTRRSRPLQIDLPFLRRWTLPPVAALRVDFSLGMVTGDGWLDLNRYRAR